MGRWPAQRRRGWHELNEGTERGAQPGSLTVRRQLARSLGNLLQVSQPLLVHRLGVSVEASRFLHASQPIRSADSTAIEPNLIAIARVLTAEVIGASRSA